MDSEIWNALLLTSIAGLSTSIGSLIGLFFRRENSKFMSAVLGFTAGVMVGVSFFELLPSGFDEIGFTRASIAFVVGFVFIFLIDYFIPHEYIGQKEKITDKTKLIIVNSPQNPTGSVMTKSEMEDIAELAEEYDVYVVSDEIYSKMTYDTGHYTPTARDEAKERTVLLDGFSKYYAMTAFFPISFPTNR